MILDAKKKIAYYNGLRHGKENKERGLGTDDWDGNYPPFLREDAREIYYQLYPTCFACPINSDEFEKIEEDLCDTFLAGYHDAFQEPE